MSAFQVRPLVVVREHATNLVSACLAFAPHIVAYGREREAALEDLTWFLGEYFAQIDADAMQNYVIPEPAETRSVVVTIPRGDLPRTERIRTPIEVTTVEVSVAEGAKWVLVPSLGHATYVPREDVGRIDEIVANDVLRVTAASDLDGPSFLDLVPPLQFVLERPLVEVTREQGPDKGLSTVQVQKRAAEKLLSRVAREVFPSQEEVLFRDFGELRELIQSPRPTSLVLVGPEGSGKSAWLRAVLADRSARRVFATSGAELVAGQSGLGQLQGHVSEIVKAVELLNAMLYFESFEDLFAGHPGSHEDVGSLLQPWIEQGRIRIVGELTPEAYDRLEHQRVGLFSYLVRFRVEPLGRDQTLGILQSRARMAIRQGGPRPNDAACGRILDLVERYEPYRVLPGKALGLLHALTTVASAERAAQDDKTITQDDVMRGFSRASGIPDFLLLDERTLHIDRMEQFFREHLVGQEHAVRRVAETVCTLKAGLQPAGKPLATLLFVGPTGVGKTELAKALARFLFGSTERMARFDMSEYTDPYAADRLIRGTDRADGVLTRRVREQPFSVLLLDEIEKAHRSVFDLLLQVTGEGRLSDARGKIAYFHNTIIILTSNLGAQHRNSSLGFGKRENEVQAHYEAHVRAHFRPEFVNRLDCIVSFTHLDRDQIREVARVSLLRILRRAGVEGRGVRLHVSPQALDMLANTGFSDEYGARGLRRHLEQMLVAPLGNLLSTLGPNAEGACLVVLHEAETEAPDQVRQELDSGFFVERAATEPWGSLRFMGYARRKRKTVESPEGLHGVSRYRREMRRLRALPPIAEARERLHEMSIQLNEAARLRKKQQKGQAIAELSEQRARLAGLLEPLDKNVQEIEEIESLLIGALQEPALPDLEPDALRAYTQFRQAILNAVAVLSQENTIVFAIHELDEQKVLHKFLLPLFKFVQNRRWDVALHVDRGERKPEDQWPGVDDCRWGPALAPETYWVRYVEPPSNRPFDTVLVRVRGPGAGALLSFAIGRMRYCSMGKCGELWARYLCSRYDLDGASCAQSALSPIYNRRVGKHQPIVLEVTDGSIAPKGRVGETWLPNLEADGVLERWSELVFDRAMERVRSGERFLPEDAPETPADD